MKRFEIIWFVVLLFMAMPLKAQYKYEDWSGTIDNKTYTTGETTVVYLTDDVTLTGTITVRNATTLRIVNNTDRDIYIHNGVSNERLSSMFLLDQTSKLTFNKADDSDEAIYNRIIIDGGANFDWDTTSNPDKWILNATTNKRFQKPMIDTYGALHLRYVTIRNFYAKDEYTYEGVSAISIANSSANECRPTTLEYCTIEKCKARIGTAIYASGNMTNTNAESCAITLKNCTIKNCVQFCDDNGWGGVIRFRGASKCNLYLTNTTITENFSHGDGAGLFWNACGNTNPICRIDGCTITNNRAKREAGGMRMEGTFEFVNNLTTVSGNICEGMEHGRNDNGDYYYESTQYQGNGGGIHVYGYAGDWSETESFNYTLNNLLKVSNNTAKRGFGGGIAFDFTDKTKLQNATIKAHLSGLAVLENTAGSGGGGIYFSDTSEKGNTFNIFLNSGSITENDAPNGGGLYVQNINIDSDASGTITILENQATNGSGGGIYLTDGNITLNTVNIQNNTSTVTNVTSFAGGGGVYVENGSFTIASGEISGNTSAAFGGGVLVKSETTGTDNIQSVTLSGGDILNNQSHYGGGLAALGNLWLTLNQVNIESNTATNGNGGGIFIRGGITTGLSDKATITYNAGVVRQNKATCTGTKPTTAYGNNSNANVTYASVAGMGGGICLGMNTTLQFGENLSSFGIYDNVADSGADDLFATENNTVVNLPDVKAMQLQGYDESESHTLFWFEDYITDDPNYDKGTKLKGEAWDSDKTNQRYRYVRNGGDGETFYYKFEEGVSSKELDNKYLCLTLGWNVGLITLIKNGMADGENAIFQILKKKDDSYKEYMTVILTDADKKDSKRSKQITLDEDGTWKIVETPWSWAYTSDYPDGIERTLDASSSVSDRTFEFTNTVKTNNPIHGESVKVNKMGKDVQQE